MAQKYYEYVGASTCTAGAVPRWRIGRQDLGRGADGTSGSGHYLGQSTYGGDYIPGSSDSGVSLDIGPMEGTSCLEPLEQSILESSWIARPRNGVIKQKSEWKPVITPASSYTLDKRPMEGVTYLERPALGVSLDSGPTEGASCPEPLEQSVLDSSLAARPVGCVIENVLDWEPLRNPATIYTLDLWRGLLIWSTQLWGYPWTVDLRRGRRVWNHWSSRFSVRH